MCTSAAGSGSITPFLKPWRQHSPPDGQLSASASERAPSHGPLFPQSRWAELHISSTLSPSYQSLPSVLLNLVLAQSRRALTKKVTKELLAPGVFNSVEMPGKHSRMQETKSELSVAQPAPLLCKVCRDHGSPCICACALDCGGPPLPNQPRGDLSGLAKAR